VVDNGCDKKNPSRHSLIPRRQRDYLIRAHAHEFTSVLPDAGHRTCRHHVRTWRDKKWRGADLAEALFPAYRNEGIFFEARQPDLRRLRRRTEAAELAIIAAGRPAAVSPRSSPPSGRKKKKAKR